MTVNMHTNMMGPQRMNKNVVVWYVCSVYNSVAAVLP